MTFSSSDDVIGASCWEGKNSLTQALTVAIEADYGFRCGRADDNDPFIYIYIPKVGSATS